MLDISKGRIPKQEVLSHQLDKWLKDNGMTWAFVDVERAVSNLRCMVQSLLALRRNGTPAPRNYPTLQILVDKLQLEEDTTDAPRQPAQPRSPIAIPRPPPSSSDCQSSESSDDEGIDADLLFTKSSSKPDSTKGSDTSVPSPFQGFRIKATSRP
eukprot:162756-Pyramimonas_sp.AAC.1